MKIYTKTGDSGTTGLVGGQRVPKTDLRITAFGEVDELNACIGVAIASCPHELVRTALIEVQSQLFNLGAQLAAPSSDPGVEVITSKHVDGLERQVDTISSQLEPLRSFILPGGSLLAAHLHLARTVCRRAERQVLRLSQQPNEDVDRWVLIYLNRMSDYLFVMARLGNQLENVEDIPWLGRHSD